eukprot:TRINITY_DN72147_c0_g1_i1.p1 TRINITY_DN72147_c0_g1~~TRINITY_DN72147_c0_g1_i1.p1  ORF type:complete len:291 (-),score=62.44 TRINITY_DN72147_c0_g1_i1:20-892(-)
MGCCSSSSSAAAAPGASRPAGAGGGGKASKAPAPPAAVLAKKVEQSKKTGVLALRECGLKKLPQDAVGPGSEGIRTADLHGNSLSSLPAEIGSWSALQNLLCAHNAISELPSSIGKLEKLQKIVLSNNQLRSLPPQIGSLGKLKILQLDTNRLSSLPVDVWAGLGGSLEELDLSSNALKDLPDSLSDLKALVRLVVAKNEIRQLSPGFSNLTKLQHLDASDNLLQSVPAELIQGCVALSELWLKGNPIERLQLQQTPGFDAFLERRKGRLDAKIGGNVVGRIDLAVCGLE